MTITFYEMRNKLHPLLQQLKADGATSGINNKNYLISWLIYQNNFKTTLDLGVHYGRSLFSHAYAHHAYTNGIVYGIDPYTKEDAKQHDLPRDLVIALDKYISDTNFDTIYKTVLEATKAFGYENNINLIKQRSDKAIEYFRENNIYFDLILIDGNHDTANVISDINLYYPQLKQNGYMILDDIHFSSVKPAYELANSLMKLCYKEEYFAIFKKSDHAEDISNIISNNSVVKLHIGCFDRILPDWVNMDIRPGENIVTYDARKRMPYADNSVDFIYSEHFIEHLDLDEGVFFFKEAWRVLRSGGVIRTSTFDVDDFLFHLNPANEKWMEYRDWLYDGLFKHMTRIELLNLAFYDTDGGHKHLYNKEELVRVLTLAGFDKFNQPKMKESMFAELQYLEYRCNSNCIVEAIK